MHLIMPKDEMEPLDVADWGDDSDGEGAHQTVAAVVDQTSKEIANVAELRRRMAEWECADVDDLHQQMYDNIDNCRTCEDLGKIEDEFETFQTWWKAHLAGIADLAEQTPAEDDVFAEAVISRMMEPELPTVGGGGGCGFGRSSSCGSQVDRSRSRRRSGSPLLQPPLLQPQIPKLLQMRAKIHAVQASRPTSSASASAATPVAAMPPAAVLPALRPPPAKAGRQTETEGSKPPTSARAPLKAPPAVPSAGLAVAAPARQTETRAANVPVKAPPPAAYAKPPAVQGPPVPVPVKWPPVAKLSSTPQTLAAIPTRPSRAAYWPLPSMPVEVHATIHTTGLELIGKHGLIMSRLSSEEGRRVIDEGWRYARDPKLRVPSDYWPGVLRGAGEIETTGQIVVTMDCRPFTDPERNRRGSVNHLGFHGSVLIQVAQHRHFRLEFSRLLEDISKAVARYKAQKQTTEGMPRLQLHVVCFCKKGRHRSVATAVMLYQALHRCTDWAMTLRHHSGDDWAKIRYGQGQTCNLCSECRAPRGESAATAHGIALSVAMLGPGGSR